MTEFWCSRLHFKRRHLEVQFPWRPQCWVSQHHFRDRRDHLWQFWSRWHQIQLCWFCPCLLSSSTPPPKKAEQKHKHTKPKPWEPRKDTCKHSHHKCFLSSSNEPRLTPETSSSSSVYEGELLDMNVTSPWTRALCFQLKAWCSLSPTSSNKRFIWGQDQEQSFVRVHSLQLVSFLHMALGWKEVCFFPWPHMDGGSSSSNRM